MKHLIQVGLAIIVIVCCEPFDEDNTNDNTQIHGGYTGTFQNDNGIANIKLIFGDSTFIGISDLANFPAIGKGIFQQTDTNIVFINISSWSMFVDSSLILDGTYHYGYVDNTLTFWKEIGNQKEIFTLESSTNVMVDEKELIKEKLIGRWRELHTRTIDEWKVINISVEDSIYQHWRGIPDYPVLTMHYELVKVDSIKVIRKYFEDLWNEKPDTTYHKLIFYGPDSLELEQFIYLDPPRMGDIPFIREDIQ